VPVAGLYPDDLLPAETGHAILDFDIRKSLGRKGTSAYDRVTGLAVVSCKQALEHSALLVDETTSARIGVALGTSLGSFKSISDYSRETLVQERPYLVNPMLFPNTVMNCAAGQVAIRFGLRGVNATIAGGALAFLNAVRYAGNAIERGYVDVMLAGAVEEFTPHRAWAGHLTGATATVSTGEAACVFVLTAQSDVDSGARILSATTAFGPGGRAEDALAGCVSRALQRSGVDAARVATVYTGETADDEQGEFGATARALGREPRRVLAKQRYGECDAASGAAALALLLAEGEPGVSILTSRGVDGAVGAAVVEVSR
jgi:3-oxoacyl-[acyl-carrier-protein] synthase II